jgi:hypothetical protein
MSIKNSSDTIGNRTRDLPACSAVPQLTAPPLVLILISTELKSHMSDDIQEIITFDSDCHRKVLNTISGKNGYLNRKASGTYCMCSGGRLLMMDTVVSETCRAT